MDEKKERVLRQRKLRSQGIRPITEFFEKKDDEWELSSDEVWEVISDNFVLMVFV